MSTADADQIEHLRRLWEQYGRLLTVAVVATLLAVFGKQFYGSYQQRQAVQSAALYATYQQSPDEAVAAQLRTEYPRSSYATFVTLAQAKQAIEAGKPDSAESHLRWVAKHAGASNDRALASLRLARVLLDQGKAGEALGVLGKDIPATSPALAEIRGDIADAQNKPQEARLAYQEALAGLPSESGQAAVLKLKLDALGHP